MSEINFNADRIECGKFTVQFHELNAENVVTHLLILKYSDISGFSNNATLSDFRLRILLNNGCVVYVTLKGIQYEKNKKFKEDYFKFVANWTGQFNTDTPDLLTSIKTDIEENKKFREEYLKFKDECFKFRDYWKGKFETETADLLSLG